MGQNANLRGSTTKKSNFDRLNDAPTKTFYGEIIKLRHPLLKGKLCCKEESYKNQSKPLMDVLRTLANI